MNVRIVPMDASHLDALAQIEQECFSLPWSRSMLEEELYNDCAAFLVGAAWYEERETFRRRFG